MVCSLSYHRRHYLLDILRSVPMKKPSIGKLVKDMTDNKHGYFMTWTYIMTFGSFSGFAASFPLMIKIIYGNIPGMDAALAPDPLKYAYLGPLCRLCYPLCWRTIIRQMGEHIYAVLRVRADCRMFGPGIRRLPDAHIP